MSRRIYVQLQPDQTSLAHLLDVQAQLPDDGRKEKAERLHMTLIHFGIIDDIIGQLPCDESIARRAVEVYMAASQQVIDMCPTKRFDLRPLKLEFVGRGSKTLVVRYELTDDIRELHAQLLGTLKQFFTDCGVEDVEKYMHEDANFKNALTIMPHVTLIKWYKGELPPEPNLQPIGMEFMPLEYDQP